MASKKSPMWLRFAVSGDVSTTDITVENETLLTQIASNYIIVKCILSHLKWQDQFKCAPVCKLWHSAVRALQRENLKPHDFNVIQAQYDGPQARPFQISQDPVSTAPLIVFAFFSVHVSADETKDGVFPALYSRVRMTHLSYPRDCVVAIQGSNLIYLPSSNNNTAENAIKRLNKDIRHLIGLYLPSIPNVNCHTLWYNGHHTVKEDIEDKVDEICTSNVIKGIIVIVKPTYLLMEEEEDVDFLFYFKKKQPDIPFALGGCMVEDLKKIPLGYYSPYSPVGIYVFTVPKEPAEVPGHKCEFEMYSLVLNSQKWKKSAIEEAIKEFAQKTPQFEYSAALKMSCVGREQKHAMEQDIFRAAFPFTTIVGCYGNGEIGLNHPAFSEADCESEQKTKKPKKKEESFLYSYSTVFVYFGWGRIKKPAQT